MNCNLNSLKLEYWLKQPEYNIPKIVMTKEEINDIEYKKMEQNNRILGRNFHHNFERWFRKWGRIPTPQEFIAMQMQDVQKNMNNEGWKRKYKISFKLTPITIKGIKQRMLRSYISFINELHTELLIKEIFPWVKIERNGELDFAGIDLLIRDFKNNVSHKIHITKNSEYAIEFLFKKEGRELEFRGYGNKLWAVPSWKRSNHSIYKNRSFKGHTFFLYGISEDDTTRIVNGYPLFKKQYIINKLNTNICLRKGA